MLHIFKRFSCYFVYNYYPCTQWRRNEFESGWHQSGAKVGRDHRSISIYKKFFGCAPPLFCGSKSTVSRFGERFRDSQYSLVSFLFAVLIHGAPRAQSFVKVGGPRGDPCPMESAPLLVHNYSFCFCLVHISCNDSIIH